ncbi:hypothetical protein [Marinobacter subterrani]|uniref:hypothetical protein n=1 Tax=Marinobacter subterrani TaxID=1658765 RepID=UPI002356BCD6|nr:hypothetical protein [Marinobacter subterrani]
MTVAESNPTLTEHYTVVPAQERMNFLPKSFGRQFLRFEIQLITAASKTIKGYRGGYWEFAHTKSGAPFAFLGGQGTQTVCNIFGTSEAELPDALAGLHASALAVLILVERANQYNITPDDTDYLIDTYHSLIRAGHEMAAACDCSQAFFRLVD